MLCTTLVAVSAAAGGTDMGAGSDVTGAVKREVPEGAVEGLGGQEEGGSLPCMGPEPLLLQTRLFGNEVSGMAEETGALEKSPGE